MDAEILDAVISLCQSFDHRFSGPRPKVVINGLDPYYKDPKPGSLSGARAWMEYLSRGVFGNDLLITEPVLHSGAEAREFVGICARENWRKVTIVTRPYHMPRCFLNHVGWALALGIETYFHCLTIDCDWTEEVGVSRAATGETTTASRIAQLNFELDRIPIYRRNYEAGDDNLTIATPEEGLHHILSRR